MNGHVMKRGKKYCVVLYLGRDSSGKKKQKWLSGFSTKKEAEKALAEKLNDMYHGVTVDVSTGTFGEYMLDWLSQKEIEVRPSTHSSYEWLVLDHLIPHLGHIKLAELKPQHLQNLYVRLLNQDSPLSKRSVLHLHNIIHQALARAVAWELVGRNVSDAVKPPRPPKKEMQVWSPEHVLKFLDASKDDRYYCVYLIAGSTGMRKGEILALLWEDVDLDNNRVQVRRTLQWTRGKRGARRKKGERGEPGFYEPKTTTSQRQVTLPPTVTAALRTYKAAQNVEKLRLGPLYTDRGLLFSTLNGRGVNPRTVDEHWYRCLEAADVPKIRFHDLRHTHATLLLQQGVHPKIVSERLGHSEVGITLNLYSHVMPGMQEKTAQDFDRALFGKARQQ